MRPWWSNCPVPDGRAAAEMAEIDALEDSIAPLDAETVRIRKLITSHESCHHKAARHVDLIVDAIGAGRTAKGPGTRAPGQIETPRERAWTDSRDILLAWLAGDCASVADRSIEGVRAGDIARGLGQVTPLKRWQVARLIEAIPKGPGLPGRPASDTGPRSEEFRGITKTAIVHDTVNGAPAELSLMDAIECFRPCTWNFGRNIAVIAAAIGGNLHAGMPFAACGRNIRLVPVRDRMAVVSDTLHAFCVAEASGRERIDTVLLAALGRRTPVKRWLAWSLGKTLRLQLHL